MLRLVLPGGLSRFLLSGICTAFSTARTSRRTAACPAVEDVPWEIATSAGVIMEPPYPPPPSESCTPARDWNTGPALNPAHTTDLAPLPVTGPLPGRSTVAFDHARAELFHSPPGVLFTCCVRSRAGRTHSIITNPTATTSPIPRMPQY